MTIEGKVVGLHLGPHTVIVRVEEPLHGLRVWVPVPADLLPDDPHELMGRRVAISAKSFEVFPRDEDLPSAEDVCGILDPAPAGEGR